MEVALIYAERYSLDHTVMVAEAAIRAGNLACAFIHEVQDTDGRASYVLARD